MSREAATEERAGALLSETIARIAPTDQASYSAARAALDAKTKPRGSLGRLEELACRISAIRRTQTPGRLSAAIVLAAADHGIAREGVSAYPQEVTSQMLANLAAGGAAVCVLARQAGASLVVVDAGVVNPLTDARIRPLRIAAGTANAAEGPAMSREQALEAIAAGIAVADGLASEGIGLVALGEMGIANTTSASALCAVLLPADAAAVCGRGTGIDDERLAHKIGVVRRAIAANAPDPGDPLGVLAGLGGFEIALLVGVALGAAARHLVVILDGFITGAAALIAARFEPLVGEAMIAAHRSPEPGHALLLDDLGLEPLFELDLRLGEGSGAALALPLVHAALAILSDMATFSEAGVTDAGR
jgi:nicotinate-nucleotide--dimethylbenzimidazole phosphoribosyltransferase